MWVRRFGIVFLLAQAIGAAIWWCLLIAWPSARVPFKMADAPDATLMAFALADFAFFIGASAASAYGLWAERRWAWPVLCIHAGAAGYAALYCATLTALTGDGLLGAVLMAPSLVVPGFLVWRLQPTGAPC